MSEPNLQIPAEDLPENAAEGSARWLAEQMGGARFAFVESSGTRIPFLQLKGAPRGLFSGKGQLVAHRSQFGDIVGAAQDDDANGIPHVLDGVLLDHAASQLWRAICDRGREVLTSWHDRDNATSYAVTVEAQR